MATYSVVFEIEVDGENPLEATKTVRDWLRNPHTDWQFYVQGDDQKIHSVDLSEPDEDAVLPAINYEPLIK